MCGRAQRAAQPTNDFRLPMPSDIAVAGKRRQHVFVSEVLGPGLIFLRRLANLTTEKRQGLPEAVRVEVGKTGRHEGVLEDRPYGAGAAPVLAVGPGYLEMPSVADHDLGRREQRIVEAPQFLPPQVVDPVNYDLTDVVADGT